MKAVKNEKAGGHYVGFKSVKKKIKTLFTLMAMVVSFGTGIAGLATLTDVTAQAESAQKQEEIKIVDGMELMYMEDERQHFTLYFNVSLGNENVYNIQEQSSVGDYIEINGKTVSEINANGADLFGNPIQNGVTVNANSNPDITNWGLHFFINDKLGKDFKLKLDDTDVVTIKSGFSYAGVTLTKDVSAQYYHSILDWKKEGDLIDTEEAEVMTVSTPVHEPTQGLWYFYARFENNPADKFFGYAIYDDILDNVYFAGKSFSQLCKQYGENAAFIRFQTGTSMQLPYEDYLLYVHISDEVIEDYPMENGAKFEMKSGLKLPSLAVMNEDISYTYDQEQNYWVEDIERTVTYTESVVTEISKAILDPTSGNHYMIVYFEKDVSLHYLPQVNAQTGWLELAYNQDNELFYYSNSYLQALIRDNIRSSVMDYIEIDGKTVRQLCAAETKIQQDQSVVVNYCGAQFDPRAIQILFNSLGDNKFDESIEHTITIKKGFTTPLFGKTEQDYSFKFTMDYYEAVVEGAEEEKPQQQEQGCSSLAALPTVGVMMASLVVCLTGLKRREDNEK